MSGIHLTLRLAGLLGGMVVFSGCPGQPIGENPDAKNVNVAGKFSWGFNPPVLVDGECTFELDGDTVLLVQNTHILPEFREVVGKGKLNGNVVEMTVRPSNGDTDYEAQLELIWSEDGSQFQCNFTDTNGDVGPVFGIRIE